MSANRLSILFFAAALLIGGTSVAALLLRLGMGPGSAQAVAPTPPASFAGVVSAGSSNDTMAAAPEVPLQPAPALAKAAAPAKAVRMRAERVRLRAARARVRAERAEHAVLLSEIAEIAEAAQVAEARSLVQVEGALRSRRGLVVVACPEAAKAAAAALSRRKS